MSLTPAHSNLIRLLAKQAVASHLTAQTQQQREKQPERQNHPVLQHASAR